MASTSPRTLSCLRTLTLDCWSKSSLVRRSFNFLLEHSELIWFSSQVFHYEKSNLRRTVYQAVATDKVTWWKKSETVMTVETFHHHLHVLNSFHFNFRHQTSQSWATPGRHSPSKAVESAWCRFNSGTSRGNRTFRLGEWQRWQWRRMDGDERNVSLMNR